MHVISALQMKDIALEEWRRLPKIGAHIGNIGAPTSHFGNGALPSERRVRHQGQNHHRICSTSATGVLWERAAGPDFDSRWRNYSHWTGDRFGLRNKSHKDHRIR